MFIQLDLHNELRWPTPMKKINAIKGLFFLIFIYVGKQTAGHPNPVRQNQGRRDPTEFSLMLPHKHTGTTNACGLF